MTGQILDLRSRGDIGTASDTAYAQLGYDAGVTLGAEICSGFRVALGANFAARGSAGVEFADFIEATLELEAGAQLRAELAAQLSPDVTGVFGLHVVAAAQLKAYIRARLAVGLSLGEVIGNALRNREGDLGLEDRLLLALVDKIAFEMGVEASAEIAVSAAAEIAARINLQPGENDEPGFDLRVNAGAGFLYGKDLSVFMRGRLPSLKDYLDDAVSIVASEITSQQDDAASRILAAGLTAAGRAVVAGMVAEEKAKEQDSTEALIDMLDAVAGAALESVIETALDEALSAALGEIAVVPAALQQDLASLAERTDLPDLATLVGIFSQFAEVGTPPAAGQEERPISRMSAAFHALVFVIDPADALFDRPLPAHVIRQANLPAGADRFTNTLEAIALLDGGFLDAQIARLAHPFDLVMKALLGSLNDAGLGLGAYFAGQTPDQETLNTLASNFAQRVIAEVFVPDATRALQTLEDDGALPPILADLMHALLHGTSKLIIPVLAELAQETDGKKRFALQQKLGHYATQMAATFMVQQISEICAVFLKSSVKDFERRIDQLRREVTAPASDFAERLVDPILGSLADCLPGDDLRRTPRRAEMLRIVRSFMLQLCDASQIAFGSQTWSEARIDRLSGALLTLTTGADDGGIDWAGLSSQDLRRRIDALADCPPLVGSLKTAVEDVGQDLAEIGVAQARIFLLYVPGIIANHLPALGRELVFAVGEEAVDVIADGVAAALQWAEDRLDEAEAALERLQQELDAAIEAIKDGVEDLRRATLAWAEAVIDDLLAALDFAADSIFEAIADFVTELLGASNPIDNEAAARAELRRVKSALTSRLAPAAFADLEATALASRHGNTADMLAAHRAVRAGIFSSAEQDLMHALPLRAGVSFEDAGDRKFGGMVAARQVIENEIVTLESKHLQIGSQTELRAAMLAKRARHLKQTRDAGAAMRAAPSIRFNAPLSADPAPDTGQRPADLPIYGPHVHVEIELGPFPVEFIDDALDLPFQDLSIDRFGAPASGADNMRSLLDRAILDVENAPLFDIRFFVNGEELALKDMQRKGTRLSGTLPQDLLRPGRNHALLVVYAAPALSLGPPIMHHVAFLRDANSFDRPSNTIGFDRAATVINSKGDDHQDARGGRPDDREVIVIHNRSDSVSTELADWEIEDARGHTFRFPPRIKLAAGERISVVIGKSSEAGQLNWIEDYGRGPIALLNNDAERLLLRTAQGRIVSQLFSGPPTANEDISILRRRPTR
ncbi:lamin tail domain-containing protein [Roseobacter sinensis]|uniref:Lamin tail domain-containing protein n=1 Tax=Roseobacter sinensis TaxID=2931391 RepID=A0ABT3BIA8_9RHOB|nr:lamin tail domain-containing protein [Roseobacter sp. WL0113]MCV3273310.1 lamin tail domain-containing protein [Roseobacter sp. WL0113]